MRQREGLGLTPKRTAHLLLRELVGSLLPWPAALYGVRRKPPRQPPHEEQLLRQRILTLKQKGGLTQRALARAIGITQSALSQALSGENSIPRAWLPQLAPALGTTVGKLLKGIEGRPRRARPSRPKRTRKERQRPVDEALRLRLQGLIKAQGGTQKAIAVGLGVTPASVSQVLTGKMALPAAWLKPLAGLLHTTVTLLLQGTAWSPR